MSWVFEQHIASGGSEEIPFPGSEFFLVESKDGRLLPQLTAPHNGASMCSINYGTWGVKLYAQNCPVKIYPGAPTRPTEKLLHVQEYIVHPSTKEVILLREYDKISLTNSETSLTLAWNPSEIQVNSSIAADTEVPKMWEAQIIDNDEAAEQETEDDEDEDHDLDKTVTGGLQRRLTPLLSALRTDVVQETPTAERMVAVPATLSTKTSNESSSEAVVPSAAETFLTAPTKTADGDDVRQVEGSAGSTGAVAATRSEWSWTPVNRKTVRSAKRSSPAVGEADIESPSKRRKGDETIEGTEEKPASSDASIIMKSNMSTRKITTYAGRKPENGFENTPSKSQHSSPISTAHLSQGSTQRSAQHTPVNQEASKPPAPQVAFSKSAILPFSPAIKFLKKQGGTTLDYIHETCTLLCVRTKPPLAKTLKLLQAIALGIPIVTDAWLQDSAKAGKFLPYQSYIPNVPAQEKEWGFTFEAVWMKPQNALFAGYTLVFTASLRTSYVDFKEIDMLCRALGAEKVGRETMLKSKHAASTKDIIVLAQEEADAMSLLQQGWTCYSKDLLTNSILRGNLELESPEFKITTCGAGEEESKTPPKKRGRPRKS